MLRRTLPALVLVLATLAPVASLLCAGCIGCPAPVTEAMSPCHDVPAPVVTADCCASMAPASASRATPAATPAAALALAVPSEPCRPAALPRIASAPRPALAESATAVPLFTLHSALLI